jgi:hypothetical protein
MKLCKDCRHCEGIAGNLSGEERSGRCMHPALAVTHINYYAGHSHPVHPTCQEARILCDCGHEGKFWEPIEIGFWEPQ